MSTSRTIVKSSLFLAVAHGASKFFSIALTAIAGRTLGTTGFGIYAIGTSIVEVTRVMAASGLDFLVAREVAADSGRADRVASNASLIKVILAVFAYFAMVGWVIALDYPAGVLAITLIVGSAVFFENLSDVVDSVFQGRERMEFISRTFLVTAIFLFASGSAALLGGLGLLGYAACFALSFVLRWLLMLRFARRTGFVHLSLRHIDRSEMGYLVRNAAPLFGATVLSLLFHRMDILMLGKMATPEEVGLYTAAVRIIDVLVLVPRILATAVYPALRRHRDEDPAKMRELVAESTRLTLVACSVVGLVTWIVAPFALRVTPGPEFVPAAFVLRVLSWGILFQGAAHLGARMLIVVEAERDVLWVGLVSMLTNFGLNWWWIGIWGKEGAAFATLTSYAVAAGLYLFFLRRRGLAIPVWGSVLTPICALAIAWAATRYSPVQTSLHWGAILVVWAVPLVILRGLRPGDLRALRRMAAERRVET